MGQLQPRTGCPTRSDVRSEGAARVRRSTPSRLRPLAEAEERSCWCHTARRPLRRQLWHTARHLGSRRRGRRWLTVVAAEEALRRRRCGGGCCGGGCCGGRSRRRALAADHARGWAPETKGRDSRPRLRAGFFSPRGSPPTCMGRLQSSCCLSVDPVKTGPSVSQWTLRKRDRRSTSAAFNSSSTLDRRSPFLRIEVSKLILQGSFRSNSAAPPLCGNLPNLPNLTDRQAAGAQPPSGRNHPCQVGQVGQVPRKRGACGIPLGSERALRKRDRRSTSAAFNSSSTLDRRSKGDSLVGLPFSGSRFQNSSFKALSARIPQPPLFPTTCPTCPT
jgi:hypothetical protein